MTSRASRRLRRRGRPRRAARSWTRTSGAAGGHAPPGARGALLALFELEKALYELRYEINNRPAWVRIPLAGLRALAGGI